MNKEGETVGIYYPNGDPQRRWDWWHSLCLSSTVWSTIRGVIDAWVAAGGAEFGEPAPERIGFYGAKYPARPEWRIVLRGQDVVASPRWTCYEAQDKALPSPLKVVEMVIGRLPEPIVTIVGDLESFVLGVIVHYGDDLMNSAVAPMRGFESEAKAWRDNLRKKLAQ